MIDPTFKQEHEFTRCKYPSKICRNTRTRKRNGQLHRFCEEHRKRANQNQKRWSASRQKRWDALALEIGQGVEDNAGSPTTPPSNASNSPVSSPASPFSMLAMDDYDYYYDGDFDALVPLGEEVSMDQSWQDAATEELRDFLGDLLLSIASDEPVAHHPHHQFPSGAMLSTPLRW